MVKADEGTAERQERLMDVRPPFIPDTQAPVAMEPGKGSLHHPAVATQLGPRFDPLACDADLDVAARQGTATAGIVVPLVRMQLGRAFAPLTGRGPDRRHGIEQRLEEHAVVAVRPGHERCQRETAPIDEQMVLGARFTAIDRVRPGLLAPLLAGTLALSTLARDQSMRSASPSRSSKTWCNRSQTPASCQSRSRRQQVTPEPHPISCGSSSQAMPLLRTKMIPVRQARSGTRGRPPLGLGGSAGSNGSTMAHNSSGTSRLLMPQVYHTITRF